MTVPHPTPIGDGDRRILSALDEHGGNTAGQVARMIGWGDNVRSGAQIVRRDLDRLVCRGLARRMDDLKPACWLRTPAGTEVLNHGR